MPRWSSAASEAHARAARIDAAKRCLTFASGYAGLGQSLPAEGAVGNAPPLRRQLGERNSKMRCRPSAPLPPDTPLALTPMAPAPPQRM